MFLVCFSRHDQNVALAVVVASIAGTSELAPGLAAFAGVLNILQITKSLEHSKLSSMSNLIKGKLRNLQNYSNILMEQQFLPLIY